MISIIKVKFSFDSNWLASVNEVASSTVSAVSVLFIRLFIEANFLLPSFPSVLKSSKCGS